MVLARYRDRLLREALALLPHGEAWTRSIRSNMAQLWFALGWGLARSEERGVNVLDEADPRTTTEMLVDWEAALGLPDECLPVPGSEAERRTLVTTRAVGVVGASPSDFVALAESIGVAISVEEGGSEPARVDETRVDEVLEDEQGDFVLTIFAPQTQVTYARVDEARVDEPLETFGNSLLECVLSQVAPAHILLRFVYESNSALYVLNGDGSRTRISTSGSEVYVQSDDGPLRIPIDDNAVTVQTDDGDLTIDLE